MGSHEQTVVRVRISPDGGEALTASLDKTARLWDLVTGRQIASFSHDGALTDADFTAGGARVFTLSAQDGSARLWSKTPVSRLSRLLPHQDHVYDIAFAPAEADGRLRLATAGFDGAVKIWTFGREDGELLAEQPVTLSGHRGRVRRLAFSADGQRLVTAGRDGTARIWDLTDGQYLGRELCRLQVGTETAPARVEQALFDPRPGGRWVLTASDAQASPLALWDATTCSPLEAGGPLDFSGSAVEALDAATVPEGVLVAAGSEGGRVRILLQRPAGEWELLCDLALHTRAVADVAISPDGSRAASAGEDHWGRVLTLAGCGGQNPRIADLVGHADSLRSVRFFPGGERLVTASRDRTARVWESGGDLVQVLAGHDHYVQQATPSPDGEWVVTASRDGTLGFWRRPGPDAPAEASPYLILDAELKGATSAEFSPDGRYVGAGYWRNAAQLWRIWADGDGLDADTLEDLRDVWGPERANLVLIREAEQFRRENRLLDLNASEEEKGY
jgi:WD40 repeat protein